MSYSVAQNTSFMTLASIVQKVISFAYFTLIARLIGVGNTGEYFFAITFTTIFTVVADFGLGPVLTREAAKFPERSGDFFKTVFTAKLLFGLASYALVFIATHVLNYSEQLTRLILLSGVTMFFDNLQTAFYSVFRAKKNLLYESAAMVGAQFLTLIIGTVSLVLHLPLWWLIIAYTIPSVISTFYAAYFLFKNYHLYPRLGLEPEVFLLLVKMAIPFALAGLIGRLYSYNDTLLMSKLLSSQELGWWSVPYKITFAFQFIPVALTASLYPAMSACYQSNAEEVRRLYAQAIHYILLVVLPLAGGLIAIAPQVILHLYTANYLPSVTVLRLLLVGLIFTFISLVNGAVLNATNRQKKQTVLLGLTLVVNVILNIYCIPRFGILGAAVDSVFSTIFFCTAQLVTIHHYLRVPLKEISNMLMRILLPALAMSLFCLLLIRYVHYTLVIVAGCMLYVVLLFISGALTKEFVAGIIYKLKRQRPEVVSGIPPSTNI